jgi:hypothetical protein
MVSNQGWIDDWLQPRYRGWHTVKEADMLHAKMDLLMKRMDALTARRLPWPSLLKLWISYDLRSLWWHCALRELLPYYPWGRDVHERQQQWLSSSRRSKVDSITPLLSQR